MRQKPIERVLKAVQSGKLQSARAVARRTGLNERSCSAWLGRLAHEGKVVRMSEDKKRGYYRNAE